LTAAPKKFLIITGEASGDLHGSRVAKAIQVLSSDVKIFAMGGEELRLAGAEILIHSTPLAVVGFTEVFGSMGAILRAYRKLKAFISREKPALLILVDFPDFNLRLARVAKKYGVPVLYYISPQIWAWRAGRVQAMARYVQKMAVIFPFEVPLYEKAGIPVEFVGHPLMDVIGSWEEGRKEKEREMFGGDPLIALLPGSRGKEISSLLPEMARAANLLLREKPRARFILPLASTIHREDVEKYLPPEFQALTIVEGKTYEAIQAAEVAIVASGTATLETAILGRPMVIIYRISPLSYWIGRALVHVNCIGLANIVAGKKIVPELLQGEACGEKISDAVLKILNEPDYRETMIAGLKEVRKTMGGSGAAARVAQIALKMVSAA
jgi:lipid-A-disaccharide synthase